MYIIVYNANIFLISVLASIDCLFYIPFEIFLVLGMISDFNRNLDLLDIVS